MVADKSYTFDNLLPYYKKSAKYIPPNASIRAANASVPPLNANSYSATGGPLEATFSNWAYPGGSFLGPAFEELGTSELPDLQSGKLIGWQYSPFAITANMERSGATRYLDYAAEKKMTNLKLYKTTLAKKILFDSKCKATGVAVQGNGTTFTLGAKKEVIVSSGVVSASNCLESTTLELSLTISVPVTTTSHGLWDWTCSSPKKIQHSSNRRPPRSRPKSAGSISLNIYVPLYVFLPLANRLPSIFRIIPSLT